MKLLIENLMGDSKLLDSEKNVFEDSDLSHFRHIFVLPVYQESVARNKNSGLSDEYSSNTMNLFIETFLEEHKPVVT